MYDWIGVFELLFASRSGQIRFQILHEKHKNILSATRIRFICKNCIKQNVRKGNVLIWRVEHKLHLCIICYDDDCSKIGMYAKWRMEFMSHQKLLEPNSQKFLNNGRKLFFVICFKGQREHGTEKKLNPFTRIAIVHHQRVYV